MPQRGAEAVGGQFTAFWSIHAAFPLRPVAAGLDSLQFAVMPVKVLFCPVAMPRSAVPPDR
jgi:hypothetical protein